MARNDITVAVKKRDGIQKASRTMFVWVALAAAIVGASLVVSGFLLQKVIFKEQVLGEKFGTWRTLVHNNEVADELKTNVRALNVNQDLESVKVEGRGNPVGVVLDALPSTANSSAFGASLQKKILEGDDVQIDSLIVNPVSGEESQADSSVMAGNSSGGNTISFVFMISSPSDKPDALKSALQRVERSIRPISPVNLVIERRVDRTSLQVAGVTYYEPAQSVDVTQKTVSPKKGFLGL